VLPARLVGDDVSAGHRDVDRDEEFLALLLVVVRPLHDDAATGDVRMELFELVRLLAYRGLEGGRSVDAMEMDLQLRAHTAPSRRGCPDAPGVLPVDLVSFSARR